MQQNWRRLRTELQAYTALRGRGNIRLVDFLREQAIELEDIYRGSGRSGWTNLKRDAGLLSTPAGKEDEYFGRRFADLLHFDDPERVDLLLKVGEASAIYKPKNEHERRLLQMFAYQVDAQQQQTGSGEDFLKRLHVHPELCTELVELGEVLQSRSSLLHRAVPGLDDVPLSLHGRYGIREILTAVGWLSAERRAPFQAGTLPFHDRKAELLFVTLDKREGYQLSGSPISGASYDLGPDRHTGGADETATDLIEISGTIKWFDVSKGYGFIVPDNGLPDFLLHVTCLRRDGFQTAYEGARIVAEVLQRPKGLQCFRILSMDESTAIHPSTLPGPKSSKVE